MPKLTTLNVYPIKACRGHSVDSAVVERRGLEHDRRLLLVDRDGDAVTQRDHPTLALVVPELTNGRLALSAPKMPSISVEMASEGPILEATVWDDSGIQAIDQGDGAADWFSRYLQQPIRLVRMTEAVVRPIDPKHALHPGDTVSFADGYPLLIASQESLDDLNARLATPVPMNRFRPNLVVSGCAPFEEDTWKRIRIGEVEIALIKPCARCEVTTIDQTAAVPGKEPLTTLATFRRLQGSKVMFAMNAIPVNEGSLQVGQTVEILD